MLSYNIYVHISNNHCFMLLFYYFSRIPYVQIKLVTHAEKVIQIKLMNDAMEICSEETFKLVSKKAAIALYRCITEMHSFYRCDTVCSDVQSQYCRDFKGTFISLFNENTPFGEQTKFFFGFSSLIKNAY